MNNPTYKAKLKKDGREVNVYLTKRETYCELPDCKVEHQKHEVQIINQIYEKER